MTEGGADFLGVHQKCINGNFVIEQVISDHRHETNSSGFVALQCADKHGIKPDVTYKIAFKNIRIREIASS